MKHSVYWDEHNYCVRMTLVEEFAPHEAFELLRQTEEMFEGKTRRCLVVDHTLSPGAVSRETRAVLERRAKELATDKLAFFGISHVGRMIARIIVTVGGKSDHTKFFDSEDAALAWVREG